MKVLFIGGTGVISSACAHLCVKRGIDLWLLNRGNNLRPPPAGAKLITQDIEDISGVKAAVSNLEFDVVVDWIAFDVNHVKRDIELFRERTAQYIFISSATVYCKPPDRWPIKESTSLYNPYWKYAQDKISCEEHLVEAHHRENFPITIVRPSHTYDRTMVPFHGGYTVLARLKQGKKVIIHGDGTSLWTLTHNKDFARGFVGLLGNHRAIGESYHITSDEILTWNQIFETMADTLGVQGGFIHVPSEFINLFDSRWGSSLLGDKAHSTVLDNSKIRGIVPDFQGTISFANGAQEIVEWYEEDVSRQVINKDLDKVMDQIIERFESIKH